MRANLRFPLLIYQRVYIHIPINFRALPPQRGRSIPPGIQRQQLSLILIIHHDCVRLSVGESREYLRVFRPDPDPVFLDLRARLPYVAERHAVRADQQQLLRSLLILNPIEPTGNGCAPDRNS